MTGQVWQLRNLLSLDAYYQHQGHITALFMRTADTPQLLQSLLPLNLWAPRCLPKPPALATQNSLAEVPEKDPHILLSQQTPTSRPSPLPPCQRYFIGLAGRLVWHRLLIELRLQLQASGGVDPTSR